MPERARLRGCFALLLWAPAAAALPEPERLELEVPVHASERTEVLSARLYRPDGPGPHPAVVDLHGCNGLWPLRTDPWYGHYLGWGLAVLQVDSFAPRGYSGGICGSLFAVPTWQRALDAHAAKDWLRAQPWVDPRRVFLTGFSHGATTTLLALDDDLNAAAPFAGAIAVAPWCPDTLPNSHTDLLILIGGADQWTPAQRCRVMPAAAPERVELVIYEHRFHSFDAPGVDAIVQGHRVAYDAAAHQDAVRRAGEFFARRLERAGGEE